MSNHLVSPPFHLLYDDLNVMIATTCTNFETLIKAIYLNAVLLPGFPVLHCVLTIHNVHHRRRMPIQIKWFDAYKLFPDTVYIFRAKLFSVFFFLLAFFLVLQCFPNYDKGNVLFTSTENVKALPLYIKNFSFQGYTERNKHAITEHAMR